MSQTFTPNCIKEAVMKLNALQVCSGMHYDRRLWRR